MTHKELAWSPWRAFLAGLALLLVLLGVLYFPVLSGAKEYFSSDHTLFFQPFATFIARGLSEGRLPLWNPFLFCGMSQVANPSPGLFYFPTYLFLLTTYSKAMALTIAFGQVVAYCAGFLLAVELGLPLFAAFGLGFILALNGYMTTVTSNYTLPATFAWCALSMALLIALARRETMRARLPYVAALSFTIHWMIMAGRPEVYVPGFLMLALCAFYPGVKKMQCLVLSAVAVLLAVMLSMMAILPTYEWTKLSSRSTGLSLDVVYIWSANWFDLVNLFVSQPLGDLGIPGNKFLPVVATRKNYYPFLQNAFLGPVVFVLCFLGLFARLESVRYLRMIKLVCLGGVVGSLLFALGKYTPFSPFVLKYLPPLAVLRYPVKLLIFTDFFLAILAALGLASLMVPSCGKERGLKIVAGILVVGLIVCGGFYYCRDMYAFLTFEKLGPFKIHMVMASAAFYEALLRNVAIAVVTALFVLAVAMYKEQLKLSAASVGGIVAGALIATLMLPDFLQPLRLVNAGYYREPYLVKRLTDLSNDPANNLKDYLVQGKARYASLYFDPLKVSKTYVPRKDQKPQYGETYTEFCRELMLPNTNVAASYPVTFGYESSETKDYRRSFLDAIHKSSIDSKRGVLGNDAMLHRFLQITGTSYVGSFIIGDGAKGPVNKLDARYFEWIDDDPAYNLRLYKVRSPRPRVYVVSGDRFEIDKAGGKFKKDLGELKTPTVGDANTFPEFRDVIEEAPDPGSVFEGKTFVGLLDDGQGDRVIERDLMTGGGGIKEQGIADKKETATVLTDKDEHLAISAVLKEDGYLVLSDHFYPGWRVTVDSFPATIARANGFMRAVKLSKGAHLVEFDYKPRSLILGFVLALSSLVISSCLALYCAGPWLWRLILRMSGRNV